MQTVLEEVGELLWHIDTWFVTFGVCSEFCLMLMRDFFLPKTSYFQSQLVYLASYLYPKTMKALNDFFSCHLFLEGGQRYFVKMFTLTADNIIYQ